MSNKQMIRSSQQSSKYFPYSLFKRSRETSMYENMFIQDFCMHFSIVLGKKNHYRQSGNVNNEEDIKSDIFSAVNDFLNKKIQNMVSDVDTERLLLVGGDVADCKELCDLFYKKLRCFWKGRIIFILGNHELWDGYKEFSTSQNTREVEEIVNEYREISKYSYWSLNERLSEITFLENDIYIVYKNLPFGGVRVIREAQILNASVEDMTNLCSKASTIILGGIGFSGLNPKYNAEIGLYRSTVSSLKQDKELTERFRRVYNKLKECAANRKVIVFTHTPVHDWTSEPCNPNLFCKNI